MNVDCLLLLDIDCSSVLIVDYMTAEYDFLLVLNIDCVIGAEY